MSVSILSQSPLEDEIETNGKKIGAHMPTIHHFTCQAFTDAVVLNVYPQFRDRSLYTTWGEWGEEFGRFWSRCHGKNLPDIPQTGFIIFLWFPSHCHLIGNQFSMVPPPPFILCWRPLIPIKSLPPWINEDCEDWSPYVTKFSDECFLVHLLDLCAYKYVLSPVSKRLDYVCDEGI